MNIRTANIYHKLIDHFGGQEKTALALGVTQPAVSGWATGIKKMSEKKALRAEKATEGEFKAVDLCPALKEFENLQ